MSAITSLPPRYRSVPSIESLASSLDRARGRNRELATKSKGAGLIEVTVATQLGAVLAGVATGRGWTPGAVGAAAAALAVAGVFTKQSALVHAANGALAPLVALEAARMAAGQATQQAA